MPESCHRTEKIRSKKWETEQEARCVSDIEQFYTNVKEIEENENNSHILDLARRYCEDTKFFLEKKDYVTAFGSINYAHGLIDAFRKRK
jgi:uncharacterized protein